MQPISVLKLFLLYFLLSKKDNFFISNKSTSVGSSAFQKNLQRMDQSDQHFFEMSREIQIFANFAG